MTPLQQLLLVTIIMYLMYNFIISHIKVSREISSEISSTNKREDFYDWQTLGVDPSKHHDSYEPLGIKCRDGCDGCATPKYIHQPGYPGYHQLNLFQDPKCVGEGSCIYNPDSQNDCVLPDWKCIRDSLPKWSDPPLDSDIFDFKKRYGYLPNTSGCLCNK